MTTCFVNPIPASSLNQALLISSVIVQWFNCASPNSQIIIDMSI